MIRNSLFCFRHGEDDDRFIDEKKKTTRSRLAKFLLDSVEKNCLKIYFHLNEILEGENPRVKRRIDRFHREEYVQISFATRKKKPRYP